MGLWKDPSYLPTNIASNSDADYANWDNEAAKVRRRTSARPCGWRHGEDRAERACMVDSHYQLANKAIRLADNDLDNHHYQAG